MSFQFLPLSYKSEYSWWVYDVEQENQFAKAFFFFPFRLVDCHYIRKLYICAYEHSLKYILFRNIFFYF